MRDELYRPLGQDLQPTRSTPRARRRLPKLAALAAFATVAGGSTLAVLEQPDFAPVAPTVVAGASVTAPPSTEDAAEPNVVRMAETGGVTVTRGNEILPVSGAPDPTTTGSIRVFDPGSLRQPAAFAASPDEALLEPSDMGMLPVRSGDGRRPLDVYAGATSGALGTRIAIVVAGLGISQTGTQQAVERLPAGVTLAFAADGNSLDRWMRNARQNGHELLLQAPLEPFGYPEISPGEDTQTVADAVAGRFDALHHALGRMTNYVGVMNYMGARFNAEPTALEPFLAEVSRRGLLYMDDGSSSRSLARDVAVAGRVPFAASDLVLDQDRSPEAIRRQLDALERVARARGTAVGVASAFETSVETIAAWTRKATGRGIEIVPVSALALDPEARR
ncbi:divergent polysaccharide deacetylase family protein [Aureimonas sp. AU4]|uniref:divergent polysaccharide deacetylase family protein n=1 Tax=Aureimonas sp. AU4 TaxID=1638163 RepID=UPI000784C4FC|nr:divergent polysaccharide deacetylase family protein [Aureimonas sp. AU4]